jgi:hypothetical protein
VFTGTARLQRSILHFREMNPHIHVWIIWQCLCLDTVCWWLKLLELRMFKMFYLLCLGGGHPLRANAVFHVARSAA